MRPASFDTPTTATPRGFRNRDRSTRDFAPVLVSCPISSLPKTRRESTSCGVTNPHQVFNLVPVRALPDADFAGFPDGVGHFAPAGSRPLASTGDIQETNGT